MNSNIVEYLNYPKQCAVTQRDDSFKDWGQVAGDGWAIVGTGRTAGTRGWTTSQGSDDTVSSMSRPTGPTHLGPSSRA